MPELPEVQTVVDTLRPRVIGWKIAGIEHVRQDMVEPEGFDLETALRNKTVKNITRRAKRIVFELDDGNFFYIHLGMTGRLSVEPSDTEIQKHTHLIARLKPGLSVPAKTRIARKEKPQLRFRDPRRFGKIVWLGRSTEDKTLGPEPLTLRASDLYARLRKTKRVIKSALLDQKLIAGLGNIYVDESLFTAKIHPQKRADILSKAEVLRLSAAIKKTLLKAIHHKGSTLRDFADADGSAGGYQKLHRVYGRENEPCAICKSPLKRIVLGGRSTHFCRQCQPRKGVARRKP